MPRKLAAGNWKMNGLSADLRELEALAQAYARADVDILICPPATLLAFAIDAVHGSAIAIGGQDCHAAASGAHTGDIAATMIADLGGSAVIVGHSERRADHGENDADVRAKAGAAHAAGLVAVICLGETLEDREAGKTLDVVGAQLQGALPGTATAANTVIAYEPVWAIGTGRTPDAAQIGEVHDFLRGQLAGRKDADEFRLLYGGSVKPVNAAEIFGIRNVDGALVGGASLKAADFSGIINAL